MFRLIAVLLVVLAMGLMGYVVLDATMGGGKSVEDCPGGTTTSLPVSVPEGVAKLVDGC